MKLKPINKALAPPAEPQHYYACGYCKTRHKSEATASRCPARVAEGTRQRRLEELDFVRNQLHVGDSLHGRKVERRRLWHTDSEGNWWSGSWGRRTSAQLHAEAKSIVRHLEELYPELAE